MQIPEAGLSSGNENSFLTKGIQKIKNIYREEWYLFINHYLKIFKAVSLIFLLSFGFGYFYFSSHPAKASDALTALKKSVEWGMPQNASPPVVCLAIFWNNIRASFVPMMGGMVPFLCLPVLLPLLNGGTLSLVAFDLKRKALNVPLIILVDIVPHGIFEVLGWLYSSCLGVYLSLRLGKRIISRRRQKEATVSVSNFFET